MLTHISLHAVSTFIRVVTLFPNVALSCCINNNANTPFTMETAESAA